METILTIFVCILFSVFVYFIWTHKGPNDLKAKDRYKQTAELTRQMRENIKKS
jgi:hypothetical protein